MDERGNAFCPPSEECQLLNEARDSTSSDSLDVAIVLPSMMKKAVDVAVQDVSETLGHEWPELAFIYCPVDSGLLSSIGLTVDYLKNNYDLKAVVGARSSFATKLIFERLQRNDVLIVSPMSTASFLVELEPPAREGEPGLLWRTSVHERRILQALKENLVLPVRGAERNPTVALQYPTYGDYEAMADTLGAALESQGLTVEKAPRQGIEPFVSGFLKLKDKRPGTIVVFQNYPEAEDLAELFLEIQTWSPVPSLFFFDGENMPLTIQIPMSLQVRTVRRTRPNPSKGPYLAFSNKFKIRFGEEPEEDNALFFAQAFDAVWLVAYGIAWAKEQGLTFTGVSLAQGLQKLSSGSKVAVGADSWEVVVDHFAAASSIDLVGASGPLDYDPLTEERLGHFEILEAQTNNAGTAKVLKTLYEWKP